MDYDQPRMTRETGSPSETQKREDCLPKDSSAQPSFDESTSLHFSGVPKTPPSTRIGSSPELSFGTGVDNPSSSVPRTSRFASFFGKSEKAKGKEVDRGTNESYSQPNVYGRAEESFNEFNDATQIHHPAAPGLGDTFAPSPSASKAHIQSNDNDSQGFSSQQTSNNINLRSDLGRPVRTGKLAIGYDMELIPVFESDDASVESNGGSSPTVNYFNGGTTVHQTFNYTTPVQPTQFAASSVPRIQANNRKSNTYRVAPVIPINFPTSNRYSNSTLRHGTASTKAAASSSKSVFMVTDIDLSRGLPEMESRVTARSPTRQPSTTEVHGDENSPEVPITPLNGNVTKVRFSIPPNGTEGKLGTSPQSSDSGLGMSRDGSHQSPTSPLGNIINPVPILKPSKELARPFDPPKGPRALQGRFDIGKGGSWRDRRQPMGQFRQPGPSTWRRMPHGHEQASSTVQLLAMREPYGYDSRAESSNEIQVPVCTKPPVYVVVDVFVEHIAKSVREQLSEPGGHILLVNFWWRNRFGVSTQVRLGQENWHRILDTPKGQRYDEELENYWMEHSKSKPLDLLGSGVYEQCGICIQKFEKTWNPAEEYRNCLANRPWNFKHVLRNGRTVVAKWI